MLHPRDSLYPVRTAVPACPGLRTARRARRGFAVLSCLALTVVTAAGCAKARAASVPAAAPLVVPQPPPRVLAPLEAEPLASSPVDPDTTLALNPPRLEAPAPAVRRPATSTGPVTSAPPAAAPAAAAPLEAPRDLRAAPATGAGAADQQRAQALLDRAIRDLNRVDTRRLTPPLLEQYELARRFEKEASEAIREKNFLRAADTADKAARIAAQLAGR